MEDREEVLAAEGRAEAKDEEEEVVLTLQAEEHVLSELCKEEEELWLPRWFWAYTIMSATGGRGTAHVGLRCHEHGRHTQGIASLLQVTGTQPGCQNFLQIPQDVGVARLISPKHFTQTGAGFAPSSSSSVRA